MLFVMVEKACGRARHIYCYDYDRSDKINMKNIFKGIGFLIFRMFIFFALFYVIGAFVGVYSESVFSSFNLWQSLLYGSLYTVFVSMIFYLLGIFFSKVNKKDKNIYFDALFPAIIFIFGAATVLTTDISKLMGNFLWLLSTGLATQIYIVLKNITGSNINYYKYVLVALWFIVAISIFAGLIKNYLQKFQWGILRNILLGILVAAVVAINLPSVIHIITPKMFNQNSYPKIDGATAAIPLGQAIATELLGKDSIEAKKFVKFSTTHNAYVNLIEKQTDIIFVAEPSEEELALAEANGISLKLTPIGMDAFVFIVNRQNSIDSLTLEQIRDIYSGEITNWSEVGGADIPIVAYQREKNSGSQTLMENVVMKGLTMMNAPSYQVSGMGGLMDVVAGYQNAENSLGYTVYYYASEMNKKESIKFLAINGTPCNKDTIRDKSYTFAGPLYAVTREGDESESVIKLLSYLLTDKGQKLVEKGGYVSVTK